MNALVGGLRKMQVSYQDPIEYHLVIGEHLIALNALIGQRVALTYTGQIHCIQCGRKTSKSFQQGHCYVCMQKIFECNNCIIHPERCLVEQQGCPKDDWAHRQCDQPHVVYLANSSALKVGITRTTQVPTRWIDQGAMQALPIFKTSNRYQAGLVEVVLKAVVSDRTQWRTMLKQDSVPLNMVAERDRLLTEVSVEVDSFFERYSDDQVTLLDDASVVALQFPIDCYPTKITSLSLDKTATVAGTLLGIKGQYWILDTGVFNVRKFSGYEVEWLI